MFQRSLKLPAPQPSTELLFSAHTEPMVRALKGESGTQVQKAAAESPAKPTEPTKQVVAPKPISATDVNPGAGEFHHTTPVELPESSAPIWYHIPVQPGQRLVIRIATELRNIKTKDWRKAVLLLKGVDSKGEVVNKPFEGVSKSSYYHAHFKYLLDTEAALKKLHSLTAPEGVYGIQVGLCCFKKKHGEKVFVNEISVKPVNTTASEENNLKGDGQVGYATASQWYNNEGRLKDPLKVMERLHESGELWT